MKSDIPPPFWDSLVRLNSRLYAEYFERAVNEGAVLPRKDYRWPPDGQWDGPTWKLVAWFLRVWDEEH
jgi:hypothetical protein